MNTDEFWQMVESSRTAGDPEAALQIGLEELSVEEVKEFDRQMTAALAGIYNWNVWGAGYLAEGGMSDDGFEYFRTWLIMQGRSTYDRVRQEPDRLAEVPAGETGYEWEGPQYIAASVYAERTDGNWPRHEDVTSSPGEQLGEGWDFEDEGEMRRRYPKLFAVAFD